MCLHYRVLGQKVSQIDPKHQPNRRRWERIPLAIPVFVRSVDKKGNKSLEFATAFNISAGGAQLHTRRYFSPETRVALEIPCSMIHEEAGAQYRNYLSAKIIRQTHPRNERFYVLGVEFEDPLTTPAREGRKKAASSAD
jgi:hypothetical protein